MQTAYTQLNTMVFPWRLASLIFFFLFKIGGLVVLECDAAYSVCFHKFKWQTEWRESTESPWDAVLPMNSIPSSSAAPFSMRNREGVREAGREKRERESEAYNSYNAVGALSYSKFTLGSHTCCNWTIKLGPTWLSLPRGPGNEPSQPIMLVCFPAHFEYPPWLQMRGENNGIRKPKQLKQVN